MFVALLGALIIGISLGLLGSGGSILTVPVLVYFVGQDEKVAIAGSLLVVGSIAAASGAAAFRQVDWPSVLRFGIPGMLGTYLGALLGGLVSGQTQLLTFVAVMLLAGLWMLKPQPAEHSARPTAQRAPIRIVLDGLLVGTLTGFVGVGGGFLIVPALVVLGGLDMQRAVASSLVIIAMKSFSGFAKYHDVLSEQGMELDWPVLGLFTALGIVGSFAGGRVGRRLDQELLRRIFAWLLILMALGMCVVAVYELVVPPADANGR